MWARRRSSWFLGEPSSTRLCMVVLTRVRRAHLRTGAMDACVIWCLLSRKCGAVYVGENSNTANTLSTRSSLQSMRSGARDESLLVARFLRLQDVSHRRGDGGWFFIELIWRFVFECSPSPDV